MSKAVKRMNLSFVEDMYDLVVYAFHSEPTEERKRRFDELTTHSLNYGFFIDEHLTSQVMATPFQVNVYGTPYKMAGIGYVASYPEYRGEGGISSIMKTMLEDLAQQGYALSYLAPFSYPFYRNYGYEQLFEQVEYTLAAKDWPSIPRVAGRIQRVTWEEGKATVKKIYQATQTSYHGGVQREDWWLDYALNRQKTDHLALYQAPNGTAEGYVKYRIIAGTFEIVEWHYLSKQAFQALAGFIGSHNGSVETFHWITAFSGQDLNYLFPTPAAEVKILPYMMARIVDLRTFMKPYPFVMGQELSICLEIEDTYGLWNHGLWKLTIDEQGKNTLTQLEQHSEEVPLIKGSIQTFTQWFMGYRTGEQLAFYERLTGDQASIQALDARLAKGVPQLEDYF